MTEILTESFCERCGTRYTFQAAAPRRQRLGKIKVLSKGLRKYVLDDNTSLDEAFAEARSDEDRELSSHQLEAFHQTFNFCMTCRQYTCANCWNEVEGRCLTCAPNLSREILPSAFPTLGATIAPAPETDGHVEVEAAPMAWPVADLQREPLAGNGSNGHDAEPEAAGVDETAPQAAGAPEAFDAAADQDIEPIEDVDILARLDALTAEAEAPAMTPAQVVETEPEAAPEPESVSLADAAVEPEPELTIEPEAVAEVLVEPESEPAPEAAVESAADVESEVTPESAALAEPEPEPAAAPPPTAEAETDDERAAAAAARTSWLLGRFRPGESLDDEIAAYEAATEAEATAEPIAVVEPEPAREPVEPEPVAVEPEPEPVAVVEPEPEPEPVAVEPEPVAAEPEPVAAEPAPAPAAPAPSRDDRVEIPTWSVTAPDVEAEPTIESGPPVAQPHTPREWPGQAWPQQSEAPAPWARPAAERTDWPQPAPINLGPRGAAHGTDTLWAESSRDVLAKSGTGVQACVSCGLPLSATARFCRRCGSRQG